MIFLIKFKKYITRSYTKNNSCYYGVSDYYINEYLHGYDCILSTNGYIISYRVNGSKICYVSIDNSVLLRIYVCKITHESNYGISNIIYDLEKCDEIYIGHIDTTTAKIYIGDKQITYKKCRLTIEHTGDIKINTNFT